MDTTEGSAAEETTAADGQVRRDAEWATRMAEADRQWQAHRDREAALLPLNKAALFEVLRAGGISSVVVSFDCSGDSGQIEDVTACTSDGDQVELPNGTVAYQEVRFHAPEPTLTVVPVRNVVENLVYELLGQSHGGWENDDGAYGEFTFDVASGSITLAYNERYVETHYHEHEF